MACVFSVFVQNGGYVQRDGGVNWQWYGLQMVTNSDHKSFQRKTKLHALV